MSRREIDSFIDEPHKYREKDLTQSSQRTGAQRAQRRGREKKDGRGEPLPYKVMELAEMGRSPPRRAPLKGMAA
jgi:hypothetical protein